MNKLERLKLARENLENILKDEECADVGISFEKPELELKVLIQTNDKKIIAKIKKLIPEEIDGFKVSIGVGLIGPA